MTDSTNDWLKLIDQIFMPPGDYTAIRDYAKKKRKLRKAIEQKHQQELIEARIDELQGILPAAGSDLDPTLFYIAAQKRLATLKAQAKEKK